jgi:fructose transport system substrate-binding protein
MKKLLAGSALALVAMASTASAQDAISACLITKTDTNPFFVKMREGAEAKAAELGITLNSYAGTVDGDHESQVRRRDLHRQRRLGHPDRGRRHRRHRGPGAGRARRGAPRHRARHAALAHRRADATFATDNFQAGLLIGHGPPPRWATPPPTRRSPC